MNDPETANMELIKSSYRRLLQEWHPDKAPKIRKYALKKPVKSLRRIKRSWITAGNINIIFPKNQSGGTCPGKVLV
jgi:hypothetical protein